jgi:hypothetical protein
MLSLPVDCNYIIRLDKQLHTIHEIEATAGVQPDLLPFRIWLNSSNDAQVLQSFDTAS